MSDSPAPTAEPVADRTTHVERSRDRRRAPEISVVTPTYNEAENIVPLLTALGDALAGFHHELIVVDDDSPDRTWERAEAFAETNPTVRVVRRFGESGLSSAVMAGMAASRGDVIAVIDADMQHDEHALPEMIRRITEGGADVSVGTRGADGGSYGEFSGFRRLVSWIAAMIARVLLRVPTSDPMSGFFAVSRSAYRRLAPTVNPQGFKILLEFIGRDRDLEVAEVGYRFRSRVRGETKLSPSVIRSYLLAVFELRLGRAIKGQFVLYCLVGASGVVVNLLTFGLVSAVLGNRSVDVGFERPLSWALLAGIAASVLSNFVLNNYFTFWERRYHRSQLVAGFALFAVVSGLGVVIHVAVFQFLQANGWGNGLLGTSATRLADDGLGYVIALVSNYFLNVNYIWRRRPST